jgi:hypothetical protein
MSISAPEGLKKALSSVEWEKNVEQFLANQSVVNAMGEPALRLALWAKQIEEALRGNQALPFVREMQVSAQQAIALTALALYKPAASAMRALFEAALYFSYFQDHPRELATLLTNDKYYVQKEELLEYHKQHTHAFTENQEQFGLVGRLNQWYARMSRIIHGQIPGGWVHQHSLAGIKPNSQTTKRVVDEFAEVVAIVNDLLLCTVAQDIWHNVSTAAKRELTKGLSGAAKAQLRLDTA